MIVSWMGRYREIVAAFVRHGNTVARFLNTRGEIYPGIFLSHQEWQVLEYIIEHESDDSNMNRISERLAIPQSSFSKIIKLLYNYHLVAKYRITGNRKNIILKATEAGLKVYESYSEVIRNGAFEQLFETLSVLSDEELAIVVKAVNELDDRIGVDLSKAGKRELIRIED
ncbi:MAG: MarR family winged helix-turn-helix transcriptional regulator [Clostridiaceae bacterium]